ncbi:Candidate type III effector Hop protein [uncultured Rubrobacteraceae bacterium]|uniref:Candidate type III effector Hop protein n=1 Tax=uncultured Rubrobacteraceae bacterium TaxID=349277 RepID=A0A6J4P473_9ACTN|nr:Candidate type III effector Hop protein [uncultured Rubrobacteraceae bacterium]
MLIAVIADDLTGAADTGVQLVRAGYRAAVVFRGEEVPAADAVSFDTDSRAMPAGFAAKRVVEAARAVRHAHLIYKKLDSTLRGNVAAELAAAFGAVGREHAIVAPAFPAAGRTTVAGNQLVHGVPVGETEMRNDPQTPVRESHVPTLLEGAFSSVGTLGADDLADPGLVRRTLEESECVVVDAERDDDLETLVRAVPNPAGALWVGSAGLALALGSVYPGPRARDADEQRAPVRPVLVVVGSMSGIAREQARRLVEEYGDVAVEAGRPDMPENAVATSGDALSRGTCAVVHSPEERGDFGESVLEPLAEIVARLSEEERFGGLVLTGGATAVGVARRLGASGILLQGEVEAGVPIGTLIGPNPYPAVTKAGGFGGQDTLLRAVEALSKGGKENP